MRIGQILTFSLLIEYLQITQIWLHSIRLVELIIVNNGKPVWNEILCKFYTMCNFSPKIGLKMPKEAISDVILDVLSFKMGVDVWKYILISLSTIRNLDPFQTGLLVTLNGGSAHVPSNLVSCVTLCVAGPQPSARETGKFTQGVV